jgi:hypothetical protein
MLSASLLDQPSEFMESLNDVEAILTGAAFSYLLDAGSMQILLF